MKQVKELWNLKIRHDYFSDGICRWGRLSLSDYTNMMLRRRGGLWLHIGIMEWKLISFEEDAFNVEDKLELEFFSNDKEMVYNTQWDWKGDGQCRQIEVDMDSDTRIAMETLPGEVVKAGHNEFFRLLVPLKGIKYGCMTVTEIDFTAKSCYWEYWLVPRNNDVNRKLELEISGAKTGFIQCEDSNNPLNIPLLKFRTSTMLKIVEKGQEKISLFEILNNGIRRPLMRNLPLPVLGRFPYKEKEDTVVSVVYF